MDLEIKRKLFFHCQEAINEKVATFQDLLKDLEDAGSDNTKSSAGDKYETETAMLHLESEKYSQQLADALRLRYALESIPVHTRHSRVQTGSVVKTNLGNFFIAVFVGKLVVAGENYFAISLNAPLGKALEGAQKGDKVAFRDKSYHILEVI